MRFLKRSRRTNSRTTARITPYFWLLVVIICGLFLQAYMHNFNIVYITLFFLVGFGLVAEFMGRMNLSRLGVRLLSRERLFANRSALYRLQILNESSSPSYAVNVGNGISGDTLNRIGAHESAIATLKCRFGERGVQRFPDTQLESFYPLPHLRFGKRFEVGDEVLVYPEPKGRPLQELLARNRSLAGERDDFDGVRRYESGDAASLIYWPSVAKGDQVMSKQFILEEPGEKLRFDFLESGNDDEERLSQLTLWVLECEKAGLAFSIVLPAAVLQSQREGIDGILETLARY